ncbi:MAG TPA: SDR family NAD(P)-dependent oxidoreductase [Allosphingosinicella sp.]
MSSAIAIVGMACRLPGADSPEAFWELLSQGRDVITRFTPAEIEAAGLSAGPSYVAAKGMVAEADGFDAALFGLSPADCALMDPQQRLFVECAWMALEDSACDPARFDGAIGVFGGSILSTYLLRNLWPNRRLAADAGSFQLAVGNDPTFLATRTSYLLGLTGPSASIGTACSTSLTAVHLACQSLLAHESDMAIAGGVSVHLPLLSGYTYEEGGILSPDGLCRPFDSEAQGTVSSDGAGAVALKRLEDALADGDSIHAVILGSAINNDGRDKVGFTAPSVSPQARVIAEALAIAGVEPADIAMIEAHAAGTPLGDPIEMAALAEAFAGPARRRPCAIGSVKSNIGHVDAAAGIAGLIKAALALRRRQIPPSIHCRTPNPRLALGGAFEVATALRPHDPADGPMRAGVSSFGIGGTNVHVVLEEPPPTPSPPEPRSAELVPISARTAAAADAAADRLADHLRLHPDLPLADVSHSLRVGRRELGHRRFVVAGSCAEAERLLGAENGPEAAPARRGRPSIAFMFPGLGDHYPAMGWELYATEPAFRTAVDECADLLRGHLDGDIRDRLYSGRDWADPRPDPAATGGAKLDLRAMLGRGETASVPSPLDQPAAGQPAIFVTEYALARLLISWGIEPDAMIGYSIGEFVAACLAGVFTLAEALRVVAARARLIEARVAPGRMMAVSLGEAELAGRLPAGISIAAVSGPSMSIVSGPAEAVEALERDLASDEVGCQRLASTHAYHSAMMEPIVAELAAVVADARPKPPRIPYVSCLSGDWIRDEEATDPNYWARHLCRTVRFRDGLEPLFADPARMLVEVGPGQSLTSHAIGLRTRLNADNPIVPAMRWPYGREAELAVLLRAVGLLWQAGAPVALARVTDRGGLRRLPLPTYPFERQRHWIDPPSDSGAPEASEGRRPIRRWFELPYWKPSAALPSDPLSGEQWLVLADSGGAGEALAARLRSEGKTVVTAAAGDGFEEGIGAFVLNPADEADFPRLVKALRARGAIPDTIVHLWSLAPLQPGLPDSERFEEAQALGFHSLMRLLAALWREGHGHELRVEIVANGLFDLGGGEGPAPEKATLLGPALVAPQERPGVACRCIDPGPAPDSPAASEALAGQLLDAFRCPLDGPAIAYRDGGRWVPDYEPAPLDPPAEGRSPFRSRGVYLITGGLGGVGLAMARHLAAACQARLVLIGRAAFPGRESWQAWLDSNDRDDPTSLRIHALRDLEALGAEILTLSADVADPKAMAQAVARAEDRFGPLNGIFHAAGAIGAETFREIAQATTGDSDTQFHAKAHGLIVLDEALGDRPLDFCVLMSSLSSVLGGLGFAAYSAANLFLDSYARARRRRGGGNWISIDWDSWRLAELRPAVPGLGGTVSDYFMHGDEAAAACERILSVRSVPQVVVSTGDLRDRLRQWVTPGDEGAAPAGKTHERPNLASAYAEPRDALEKTLAAIWRDLFMLERVGIHDNFFELGGHSLLATRLNARIASELAVELSLAAVLQAPTIAELGQAVIEARVALADPSLIEAMLAEIGDIAPDELDRLLAEEAGPEPAAGGHG